MAKSKIAAALTIALSVLVGGAAYALRAKHGPHQPVAIEFEALPMQFGSYLGREVRFDDETYEVLRADASTLRQYVDAQGASLWAFIAYFGEQNYGEQIHSPRNCLPGGGWTILALDRVPLELPGRGSVPVNRMLIELEGQRQIMYYFFITRVGAVASEYRLKFELARAALTFQPRDAIFVRVSAPLSNRSAADADQRLFTFLAEGLPLLSRGLPF